MRLQWLVVLVCGALVAADKPNDDIKKEKEKLQGTWKAISRQVGVKKDQNPEKPDKMFLVFEADKFKQKSEDKVSEYTFELDPSTDPKSIDLVTANGSKRPGIYKLEGDKLTIAMDRGVRPTEFKAPDGTTIAVLVLERQKP